jgi:hypothetical protein
MNATSFLHRSESRTAHEASDPQYELHMDNAVGPIFKVWVYPEDAVLEDGPLHYARGSHELTAAKLAWLHESTLPPAKEAMIEPALRLRLSPEETGFASALPVLPLPGAKRTLVIADTSGIHHRGRATVGTIRRSWRLVGDNDGGLPRLDPFRELREPTIVGSSQPLRQGL